MDNKPHLGLNVRRKPSRHSQRIRRSHDPRPPSNHQYINKTKKISTYSLSTIWINLVFVKEESCSKDCQKWVRLQKTKLDNFLAKWSTLSNTAT